MLKTDYGKFKYLGLLAALSITFGLVTSFTKARLVSLFGVTVPVSIYCFPIVYLIAGILTEVYGYAQARSVLWLCIFCRLLASTAVCSMLTIPPSSIFKDNSAYQLVLSTSMRMSIAALFAMFSGDICNNYILAKMKLRSKGKHLWLRLLASTLIGESVNTLIGFFLAFYGVLSSSQLLQAIVMGILAKSVWEIIAIPMTYAIVRYLKKIEKVDFYDEDTDFNPFITDANP